MAEYRATTAPRPAEHEAPPLEFPGCRPVRISRAEIVDYEHRIETGTPLPGRHGVRSGASTTLVRRGSASSARHGRLMRGSPMTLRCSRPPVRSRRRRWRRILEADRPCICTRARRGPRVPGRMGSDTLPDVVLEVDNTTDATLAAASCPCTLCRHYRLPGETWATRRCPRLAEPARGPACPGLRSTCCRTAAFARASQPRLSQLAPRKSTER